MRLGSHRDLHVASVAHVDAALVCQLVGAVLQADDLLAFLELLIGELSLVLVGLFGA